MIFQDVMESSLVGRYKILDVRSAAILRVEEVPFCPKHTSKSISLTVETIYQTTSFQIRDNHIPNFHCSVNCKSHTNQCTSVK